MGIQAWFIILGVGAMTLIVLDGKRGKSTQRIAGLSDRLQHLSTVSASPTLSEPLEEVPPLETADATGVEAALEPSLGGSRIGAATRIAGKVIADEPVHIKGHVTGTVIAPNHTVSVTATGYVTSYVEGSRVEIDGHVVGTLKANMKATLLARAHIQGVIEAPRLACMPGAWLQVEVAEQDRRNRPKVAMVS
tara:strand:+ start:1364 stop:1939 length:576 start_codon:yes stop_codon:yes gene_type:complete